MDETLRGQTVRVVCAAFNGGKPGVVRGEVEDGCVRCQVRRTLSWQYFVDDGLHIPVYFFP